MAKPKNSFYAVKKGKKTGIFTSWKEAQPLVVGFQGAIYKGFVRKEDAENFMNDIEKTPMVVDEGTLVAYVDGSYNPTTNQYGSGIVLIYHNGEEKEIALPGKDNTMAQDMRNVTGEIRGSMEAINVALIDGFDKIKIYHDYEGVSQWANGNWKAKNEITQFYVRFCNQARTMIDIEFEWVKGHSNDYYNEKADKLAKQSVGL